ncbi:hypothetical protein [Butyrivibrio sp. AE2032]|uniref:hypothetical protein n=1 Tax=Butyrivibrio sp. AE2032 TaxID=1458463 RepID=UPI00163B16B8|nr:hypothetical protein [Butyrivibrio sp. AE2032]
MKTGLLLLRTVWGRYGTRCLSKNLSSVRLMMTDKNRIDDGCPVDDLTAPLLPKYWAKFSNVSFEAPQQNYNFSYSSIYSYLDEDGKMLYYYDTEGLYCVSYG